MDEVTAKFKLKFGKDFEAGKIQLRQIGSPKQMHYVSYNKSRSVANIVVDGNGNEATMLVLSHWRHSGTPETLRDDSSAQIVFKYLAQPQYHVSAQAVTNDHFDADGLVGIFSVLNPEESCRQKDFFEDVAAAGDFNIYKDRDAAHVSFVIDAWLDAAKSPLNQTVFDQPYSEFTNILYEELIPRFPQIVEKIDRFEKFWIDQDELLTESEEAFEKNRFRLQEYPEIDLAIVTMPEANLSPRQSVHRMAIHNRTNCLRILLLQENKFELYYRYESWVDFFSRPTQPRIDLKELAQTLSKQESMDGVWKSEDVQALSPTLKLHGAPLSLVPQESFKQQVIQYLTQHKS